MTCDDDLVLLAKYLFFKFAAGHTPTDQQFLYAVQDWRREAYAHEESDGND